MGEAGGDSVGGSRRLLTYLTRLSPCDGTHPLGQRLCLDIPPVLTWVQRECKEGGNDSAGASIGGVGMGLPGVGGGRGLGVS